MGGVNCWFWGIGGREVETTVFEHQKINKNEHNSGIKRANNK